VGMPIGPDPSAGYLFIQDEMIRRAPHRVPAHGVPVEEQDVDPTYQIDNRHVYRCQQAETNAKDHQRMALLHPMERRNHHMGTAVWLEGVKSCTSGRVRDD
jgi:hypothetical protein